MPEKPTKDKDGHLIATFDILDTPNGRIAHTLAKYGYKLGISSRGGGDTYEDFDGQEHVNEDTYDFQGFDLVLLPAVKAARLEMVESLQSNSKSFKKAISEALDKATPDEKKIMTETLSNLNIKYDNVEDQKHQIKLKLDSLQDTLDWALENGYSHRLTSILNQIDKLQNELKNDEYNHDSVIDNKQDIAANNAGASLVKELQDSLLAQQKLEAQITSLQEKLSVCYAKEARYEDDIAKYKAAIRNLSESASNAKALQGKVDNLTEELNKKDLAISAEQEKYQALVEKQNSRNARQSRLTESISAKTEELKKANAQISALNEKVERIKQDAEAEKQELKESIAEQKKNLTIKTTEYNNKLAQSNKLVEQYRKTAKTAVNKYIESQALMLGVDSNEIKNKLPENYSFDDIDSICESLRSFNLKVSNLPVNLQQNKVKKVVVTESKESIVPRRSDDIVDESLLRLANLIN